MRRFSRFFSAICLSAVLFIAGCTGPSSNESYAQMGRMNDTPLFTLKDLEGEDVSLEKELKSHKAVLVNFWATWCPPCREEVPGLIALQEKYGKQSFTVLGVDVGESDKKVSSFARKMGINYPLLLDRTQAVAESYDIMGIPTSFLVNSEGKILGTYHAYTQKLVNDIEKALN